MTKIADIIKYEGDNSTFVWKHPCEDFNTMTQLIVHESQEAIFFMNGEALDTFGPGRHTLETQNIPLLSRAINSLTGNKTPFHCEVYFINKTVQMAIKWGTDSKVRYLDNTHGIPIEIGACGELNLAVSDSRKLLIKIVGTMNGIAWGDNGVNFAKSIQNSFRSLISTSVKTSLPATIKAQNIDIFEIDENLDSLSENLRQKILPGFEEYGLTIPQFYITNVLLPEDDPNFRRMKELHTLSFQAKMIQAEVFMKKTQLDADTTVRTAQIAADTTVKTAQAEAEASVRTARAEATATAVAAERKVELEKQTTETEIAKKMAERKVLEAQAEAEAGKAVGLAQAEVERASGLADAEIMQAKGYTQRDVLQADVQKAYAEGFGNMTISGSGGGIAGDMLGIGVGIAAAGTVAPKIGEMFNKVGSSMNSTGEAPKDVKKCNSCGAVLVENSKFCLECGEKVATAFAGETVVCPSCGKTVAKGKFCLECGYKFITNCPKCNKEVIPGAKFCLECGEKL